jgi:hypothetical protein
MDFEIERFTRQCHATGRELGPGEAFFSVVVSEGSQVRRYDYAADAWPGPPDGAIGWWKSQRGAEETKRRHWAPNDVILDFFDRLEQQPENQDMRYVLALLLVRRRVLRSEESQKQDDGREVLVLSCPRRDATYHVPVIVPDEARAELIQNELARLLQ